MAPPGPSGARWGHRKRPLLQGPGPAVSPTDLQSGWGPAGRSCDPPPPSQRGLPRRWRSGAGPGRPAKPRPPQGPGWQGATAMATTLWRILPQPLVTSTPGPESQGERPQGAEPREAWPQEATPPAQICRPQEASPREASFRGAQPLVEGPPREGGCPGEASSLLAWRLEVLQGSPRQGVGACHWAPGACVVAAHPTLEAPHPGSWARPSAWDPSQNCQDPGSPSRAEMDYFQPRGPSARRDPPNHWGGYHRQQNYPPLRAADPEGWHGVRREAWLKRAWDSWSPRAATKSTVQPPP
jgi:hypothetical protein